MGARARTAAEVAVIGSTRHADAFAAEIAASTGLALRREDDPAAVSSPTGPGIMILAGPPPDGGRAAEVSTALDRGWAVLVAPPVAVDRADAEALIRRARSSTSMVACAEPLCVSPVITALAAELVPSRVTSGSFWVRRAPDRGDDPLALWASVVAGALAAVADSWGSPTLDRCGDATLAWDAGQRITLDVGELRDAPTAVGYGADGADGAVTSAAVLGCQFAGEGVAVTAEVWPHPDLAVNGVSAALELPRTLDALGYAPLVAHAVGAVTGRGGRVVPIEFGVAATELARRCAP